MSCDRLRLKALSTRSDPLLYCCRDLGDEPRIQSRISWPEKRNCWEVGPQMIEETQTELTLESPRAAGEAEDVNICLRAMWNVLDALKP